MASSSPAAVSNAGTKVDNELARARHFFRAAPALHSARIGTSVASGVRWQHEPPTHLYSSLLPKTSSTQTCSANRLCNLSRSISHTATTHIVLCHSSWRMRRRKIPKPSCASSSTRALRILPSPSSSPMAALPTQSLRSPSTTKTTSGTIPHVMF